MAAVRAMPQALASPFGTKKGSRRRRPPQQPRLIIGAGGRRAEPARQRAADAGGGKSDEHLVERSIANCVRDIRSAPLSGKMRASSHINGYIAVICMVLIHKNAMPICNPINIISIYQIFNRNIHFYGYAFHISYAW
ncbi:hypothetical protein [Sphingopyxis sp.]|uniref:hypothetical protein n=1 Tax=Sphingopyxis sp. TaxID=1908224 RepID=UPI002EDA356E